MIGTKIEKLCAGNLAEVVGELDGLRANLVGVNGNAAYARAYLAADVIDTARRDYGVEGVRSQLVYALVNLSRWQGEAARQWKRWLQARAGVA